MAAQYKVGNFQLNTSTGTQSVSGLGFQPKAIMFYHQPHTVAIGVPQIANWYGSVGMSDGTNTYSMWSFAPNGNAGAESTFFMQSTLAIIGGNNGSTVWGADLQSFDGDGFTINITVAPPLGYWVGYMAFGGDGDYAVGTFNATGSTGSQAVTGVGFNPTGLMIHTLGRTDAYTPGPTPVFTNAWIEQSFGFSDGTNDRSVGFSHRDSGLTVKVSAVVQTNTSIITNPIQGTSPSVRSQAAVSSFDADGFTLNWTNNATTNSKHMFLAIGNTQTEVGSFFVPTSTGVSTVASGLAFQPAGAVFLGSGQNAYNVVEGNGSVSNGQGAEFTYGMATASDEQFNIEANGVDFTTTTYYGNYSSDLAVQARYQYNNRGVLQEQCAFDSFGATWFDFNVLSTVGSGNSIVNYFALEGDGGGPEPPDNPTGGSGGVDSPDSIFLQRFIGI